MIIGEDPFAAHLFLTDVCRATTEAVAPVEGDRVSSLDAASSTVAVAAAPSSADQVFLYQGGDLVPLLASGAPLGRAVATDIDGRVAYLAADANSGTVNLLSAGRSRVVFRSNESLLLLAFGSGHELLVAVAPTDGSVPPVDSGPAQIHFVGGASDGTVLETPLRNLNGLTYDPTAQRIYASDLSMPGVVMDREGKKIDSIRAGWSVTGRDLRTRRLLLTRSGVAASVSLDAPNSEPEPLPPRPEGPVIDYVVLD